MRKVEPTIDELALLRVRVALSGLRIDRMKHLQEIRGIRIHQGWCRTFEVICPGWELFRDGLKWSYSHKEYDGPEDNRSGWTKCPLEAIEYVQIVEGKI